VDALYILLGGTMTVSISEDNRNPLARAFAALEGRTKGREVETVSRNRGETPSSMSACPLQLSRLRLACVVDSGSN